MDSHQLIQALHEAQRRGGGKAVTVRVIRVTTTAEKPVEVTFNAVPPGRYDNAASYPLPEIHIKCA